jgi:hypothetical protein
MGIKNVINLPYGLVIKYYPVSNARSVRIKMLSTLYGIDTVPATNNHAGCVRIKPAGTVLALELAK